MKIAADISMGVENGVEAVPFIMQQVLIRRDALTQRHCEQVAKRREML